MNACTKLLKAECVHGAKRVSPGTCYICPAFVDSGKERPVKMAVKGKSDPNTVRICSGHHLKWPVAVWQRFQSEGKLVGNSYHVPRALFDEVKHLRADD